ncbi:unnamed protein product [Brachionus calyciflorus]|uniref:MHD domain-containing protein n=1 Tax=Brachionus calyciflorus TaxID=104777 RepID=A0A814DR48_9BILA|nr:unnamed protein product [Brachionus calyciflorus]
MYLSAIFILDSNGKVLIFRNYRGDIETNAIDRFWQLFTEREDESSLTPIIQNDDITFIYLKCNNIFLVAMTKINTNSTLVLSFLFKITNVFCEYFKKLEEESVRDNFVIIYELLDEFIDFGLPQTTDSKILQEYITQKSHTISETKLPPAVTNAVSWRGENIKYKINEVFMDAIESVNVLVSSSGNVMRSEIVGQLKMRVYLSGMPELRLGLNDKIQLEDVKFHQCVRLSRYENDRSISFIPPDGEFELMSYRLSTPQIRPLFQIEAKIERFSHSRVEYLVKAKSQFRKQSTAHDVEIIVPVASDVDGAKFKTSNGYCKYIPEKNCFVWRVKSFPGGKEYLIRAHFNLPSVESEEVDAKRPIQIKFEIPYFTTSGLQVKFLKIIEKSGYAATPWVRYLSKNGDYEFRTS